MKLADLMGYIVNRRYDGLTGETEGLPWPANVQLKLANPAFHATRVFSTSPCAIKIQDELEAVEKSTSEDSHFRFRIGLSVGELLLICNKFSGRAGTASARSTARRSRNIASPVQAYRMAQRRALTMASDAPFQGSLFERQ
ncbi:hypothetical protein [Microvirga sp. VF16]|uniref:hypothetical protein n=1 Tax=Microvirga sp. VF16 TaxID=2807101 RepID=UPI00193EA3AB|nr:hypothetical protein [Microvirga sp. VF16]QRM35427.1 hypothetical protein JO965_44580 [Microvirga sp. VF16]